MTNYSLFCNRGLERREKKIESQSHQLYCISSFCYSIFFLFLDVGTKSSTHASVAVWRNRMVRKGGVSGNLSRGDCQFHSQRSHGAARETNPSEQAVFFIEKNTFPCILRRHRTWFHPPLKLFKVISPCPPLLANFKVK
jgi:hypothetical protein